MAVGYTVMGTPLRTSRLLSLGRVKVLPGTLLRDVGLQYEYIPLRRRYDSLAQHHCAWYCIEVARDLC